MWVEGDKIYYKLEEIINPQNDMNWKNIKQGYKNFGKVWKILENIYKIRYFKHFSR